MRLMELNAMVATVRQRKEKAQADAARLEAQEAKLVAEQQAEAAAIQAALKEAE